MSLDAKPHNENGKDDNVQALLSSQSIEPQSHPHDKKQLSCLFVWPNQADVVVNQYNFCVEQLQEWGIVVHFVTCNSLSSITHANLNGASAGVDTVVWVLLDPTEYQSNEDSFYLDKNKIQSEIEVFRASVQFETLIIMTTAEILNNDIIAPKDRSYNVIIADHFDVITDTFENIKSETSPYKSLMRRLQEQPLATATTGFMEDSYSPSSKKPDFRDRQKLRQEGKRGKKISGNNKGRGKFH